jgi:hypothetical protein
MMIGIALIILAFWGVAGEYAQKRGWLGSSKGQEG